MSDLSDAYAAVWDGQLGCYDASTISIGGTAYACDEGEQQFKNTRTMEGLLDEPACVVTCKQSLFAAMPSLQAVAVFRGKNYKIDRITSPPDQTTWTFYLEPKK